MLEDIQKNIEKLIALYETQKQENERLRAELEASRQTVASDKQQIADLGQEVKNLKLAGAFVASSQSSVEAKQKIAGLIRDIDKCIALLEK